MADRREKKNKQTLQVRYACFSDTAAVKSENNDVSSSIETRENSHCLAFQAFSCSFPVLTL